MRTPIIAGNWKMNCVRSEAAALTEEVRSQLDGVTGVEVVLCPPFTALGTVHVLLDGSDIYMGGQNMFWKEKGAYTGQISAQMLLDAGCRYVIIGHSEPRGRFGVAEPDFNSEILRYFGDTDSSVNRKLTAALEAGLSPICCVGETLSERQEEQTDEVITSQLKAALVSINQDQAASLVFAYEPVWAIGTGEVCGAAEADRVCGIIRSTVGELYNDGAARRVRIQYGGSVKPDNAAELLSKPNIDGALVGGASLKARDFAAIVCAASQVL